MDGCRGGWFFACIGPGDEVTFGVFSTFEKLWEKYRKDTSLFLVDIPIGLPSSDKPVRQCDREARKLLGPKRGPSIFPPPSRDALKAASYAEACRINERITGKKITRQAWGIAPKIREMDALLGRNPKAIKCIRETHPEICFWALNNGKAMGHSKKSEEGFDERIEILKQHYPTASAWVKAAMGRYPRKSLSRDDAVDASVLAITAAVSNGRLATIPEKPLKDDLGLPMEMAYLPFQKVETTPHIDPKSPEAEKKNISIQASITLFTIGFTKKTAEEFFEQLKTAGIRRVVDIRLSNTSQLAGFAKQDDLIYFLKAICSIDYVHVTELAPTRRIMGKYRQKMITWEEYESEYASLIADRKADNEFLSETLKDGDCLLCSEATPECCHRRLVAERFRSITGDVDIVHL